MGLISHNVIAVAEVRRAVSGKSLFVGCDVLLPREFVGEQAANLGVSRQPRVICSCGSVISLYVDGMICPDRSMPSLWVG